MTRGELIQACIAAEVWANEGEMDRVLDAAEPIIRADFAPEQLDLRFPDFAPVVGAVSAVLTARGLRVDVDDLARRLGDVPVIDLR